MSSALYKKRNLTLEPVLRPAVFLGYVMRDGGKWFGEYLWAFVEDLADKPFWRRSRRAECRVTVHSGCGLRFDPKQPSELPCASLFRRDNNTAEGVQRCIEEHAQAEALELDNNADADGSRADVSGAPPPGEEGVLEDDPSQPLLPVREEFPTVVHD